MADKTKTPRGSGALRSFGIALGVFLAVGILAGFGTLSQVVPSLVLGLPGGTTNLSGLVTICDQAGSCPTGTSSTGDGELLVEGDLEVDGNTDLDGTLNVASTSTLTGAVALTGGVTLPDNADITLGTGSDANISFDAVTQAPDTLFIGVGAESRQVLIAETADIGTDLTIAQQTNPTLNIHSADATTATDYVTIAHDQTNGIIATGGGDLHLKPAVGVDVVGPTLTSGGTDDAGLRITQTLNDTGAAGGTDLYNGLIMDITETDKTGWDTVNLMDLQVGSASKFLVNDAGNVTVAGTLGATGNFAVNTSKFTVTAASGNAAVAGTLNVSSRIINGPWFSTTFNEGASKGVANLQFDGTAYDTTADAVNVISYGAFRDRFVFETNTTAAGTCTPTGVAAGLNLCVGAGNADEWTLTAGGEFGTNGGIIIPGTTPAWTACATATIADISTISAVYLAVTTPGVPVDFAAADPNYGSYAAIGALANENITVSDQTTGPTDTQDNWADTEQHTLCILSDGAGVITYTVDGSPPTATDAHTLADGVPHVIRWQELAGTGPGVVSLDALSLLPQ